MIPIFLVADGRSGTTFLMRLLASHPQIVSYEKYPLEFRPMLFSLYPDYPVMRQMLDSEWHFDGDQQFLHEPLNSNGTLPIENVAKIYSAIARASTKQPRYFAEKCPVGLDFGPIQRSLPAFRCLLLVRDPRDVVLSTRAFNRKRGFFGLREKEGFTAEDLIIEYKRGHLHIMSKLSSIKEAYSCDMRTLHCNKRLLYASYSIGLTRMPVTVWLGTVYCVRPRWKTDDTERPSHWKCRSGVGEERCRRNGMNCLRGISVRSCGISAIRGMKSVCERRFQHTRSRLIGGLHGAFESVTLLKLRHDP